MQIKTASVEESRPFGGMTPAEAARKGAEARSAKAKARREAAEAAALDGGRTFRQRLGISLSKLDQPTLDALIERMAKAGNVNALARLADQAFGRPSEQDESPAPSTLSTLTRDQLAGALAELDSLPVQEAGTPSRAPVLARDGQEGGGGGAPSPATAEPQAGVLSREPLPEPETPKTPPENSP